LQKELGLTYLLITHDLGVVEYLANRVAVMYLGRIVEIGNFEEIFRDAAHPYTQALLSAVPNVDDTTPMSSRIILRGSVPSPANPPTGCTFHPRCHKYIGDVCRDVEPLLNPLSGTRKVSCHLYPAK
jgi:peptide/nickel transport system ATP-binding protein/oligopeptide transport system ATP-binding protein